MPVRSADQFEREATRNILHHKSSELNDVITKLRLYHGGTGGATAVREHLLLDLRASVRRWRDLHPKEFAARHGAELLGEVEQEAAGAGAEHLPLVDGDILFRWVPTGLDQRGGLQALISGGQVVQHETHRRGLGRDVNLQVSVAVVQHVGVYADGLRIEIGGGGLVHNLVGDVESYDLVVRSRLHGRSIARAAQAAVVQRELTAPLAGLARSREERNRIRRFQIYPLWDFVPMMAVPHPGAPRLARERILLSLDDAEHRRRGRANHLRQRVICSHFVNAVLYAAIRPGGTLATATDHAYDDIFKVSPAQMWREFMLGEGLWAETRAVFVGLQHRGRLDRNIDPRALGVGLRMPPVPRREGRPPVSDLTS